MQQLRRLSACFQRVAVIGLYLSLNISINLLNKFIISRTGFAFPLTLSLAHMVFTVVTMFPLMTRKPYRSTHLPTLSKSAIGLLVIGVSFSANLAANNLSLLRISLSLNQMIRASIPLVTSACAVCMDRVLPTRRELAALLALTLGVCAVLAEDVHADALGIALCAFSTVANGIMMSASGAMLQEKLDVWRLSFYQAPIVVATLLPVYMYAEHARVAQYLREREDAAYIAGLILLTCVIAIAYNAVHGIAIKMTSATTTTVIGQGKILVLLFLSALVLGERDFFDWRTLLGGAVAIAGLVAYSVERTRINERKHAHIAMKR
jgi:drug/metabolite transporter (DMT)-like permease